MPSSCITSDAAVSDEWALMSLTTHYTSWSWSQLIWQQISCGSAPQT